MKRLFCTLFHKKRHRPMNRTYRKLLTRINICGAWRMEHYCLRCNRGVE